MSGVGVTFFPSKKAFTPLSIAGCVMWFDAGDASTITTNTDGSLVTLWADKGSGNKNLFATAGDAPTYKTGIQGGGNIVRFNGSKNLTSGSTGGNILDGKSSWTFFTVTKPTTLSSEQSVITAWFNTNLNRCFYSGTALITTGFSETGGRQQLSDVNRISVADTTARSTSVFQITTGTAVIGGSVTQYLNNVQTATNSPYFTSGVIDSNGKTMEVGVYTGSNYFTGDMAELIGYDTALSVPNQTLVYNYLKAKWGL